MELSERDEAAMPKQQDQRKSRERRKQLMREPAKMSPAPVLSKTFTLGTSTWDILFPSRTSAGSLHLVTTAFLTFLESLTRAALPSLVPVSAYASSRSILR